MTIKVCNMLPMVLISSAVKEYNNNGRQGLTYSLSIEMNGEVGTLPCTKEAFEELQHINKYSKIMVCADYNTAYKNLRVTDVKPE